MAPVVFFDLILTFVTRILVLSFRICGPVHISLLWNKLCCWSYWITICCRYVRNLPSNQNYNLVPFNMQKVQHPFVQYDIGFSQLGQMQRTLSYRPPTSPAMGPFSAMGLNQTSRDATYMQWPSAAMMYAHSYEPFRHAVFQVGHITRCSYWLCFWEYKDVLQMIDCYAILLSLCQYPVISCLCRWDHLFLTQNALVIL